MHNIDLTPETVIIYTVKAYEKPTYIKSELADDLKHFGYLRRLFRRYTQTGELKERLILNHLIIVYNIFGIPAATRLLFYHVRPEDYAILKTFLVFLDKMPEYVYGIKGNMIDSKTLMPDQRIVTALRSIRQYGTQS